MQQLSTSIVVGQHLMVELLDCDPLLLDDHDYIVNQLRRAARRAHATVLTVSSHAFIPQGITAIALLAESHMSIHTWPEHGYAAVDVFTCGETMDPQKAITSLKKAFNANEVRITKTVRGM